MQRNPLLSSNSVKISKDCPSGIHVSYMATHGARCHLQVGHHYVPLAVKALLLPEPAVRAQMLFHIFPEHGFPAALIRAGHSLEGAVLEVVLRQ